MENKIIYIDNEGNNIYIEKEIFEDIETETLFRNGVPFTRIHRRKGMEETISYFVFSTEEKDRILALRGTISIIFKKQERVYSIAEYSTYVDHTLTHKSISVNNNNEEDICHQFFQIKDGDITSVSTEKWYYEDGEEKYLFEYNDDGTCLMIDSVQTYQEDIFGLDIGTPRTSFTWDGFSYYQFATPLVPVEKS